MNREQILTSVRRKSSAILKKEIEKETSPEKRELIEFVLKQRGAFEEKSIERVPLTKEQISTVDQIITEVCEINHPKLTSEIGRILDTVEEYSDLTVEQVSQIEKAFSIFKKALRGVVESKKRPLSSRGEEIDKEYVDSLIESLQEKKITKKLFIESCVRRGIERKLLQTYLPKGLIDPTYIYDLYKANQ